MRKNKRKMRNRERILSNIKNFTSLTYNIFILTISISTDIRPFIFDILPD